MGKILMVSGMISVAFLLLLSIMSAALLARLSRIREERGIPSWDEVHLVDIKTSMGCTVNDLIQDLQLSLRGFFISGIIMFIVIMALRKFDTFKITDRIFVCAGFAFGFIFTWFSIRLNVLSASRLISNVIKR